MLIAGRGSAHRDSVGMAHAPHHEEPQRSGVEPITLRGPAAMAAALPHLLHPAENDRIVVAVLGPGGVLRMIAHRPLPPLPGRASAEVQRHWAGLVERLITDGLSDLDIAPDERAAVALDLPDEQLPCACPARLFLDATAVPAALLDVMLVAGGRWRSLLCDDPQCCPAAGQPAVDERDAVAAMIAADADERPGLGGPAIPAPAPPAVAASLAGVPFPATLHQRRGILERAWPWVDAVPSTLSARQAAVLIMAADRPGIRDALLTRIARSQWCADAAPWLLQWRLWRSLGDAAPLGWAAGPRCMQAISAWSLGQSQDAHAAVRAALCDQPGHRMATLLGQLLGTDVVAQQWFASVRRLSESECLLFDRPAPERSGPEGPGLRDAG